MSYLFKAVLLLVTALISTVTTAQKKFEFKTGVSVNAHFANDNSSANTASEMRINYGVGLETSIAKYLTRSVQVGTGLEFSQLNFDMNYRQEIDSNVQIVNHKISIIQTEIPLVVSVLMPSSTNENFFITAGCAFRYVPFAYANIEHQSSEVSAWVWEKYFSPRIGFGLQKRRLSKTGFYLLALCKWNPGEYFYGGTLKRRTDTMLEAKPILSLSGGMVF